MQRLVVVGRSEPKRLQRIPSLRRTFDKDFGNAIELGLPRILQARPDQLRLRFVSCQQQVARRPVGIGGVLREQHHLVQTGHRRGEFAGVALVESLDHQIRHQGRG